MTFLFPFQANLVAAFEQSLVNMTSRLRQLADTAEEKASVEKHHGGSYFLSFKAMLSFLIVAEQMTSLQDCEHYGASVICCASPYS